MDKCQQFQDSQSCRTFYPVSFCLLKMSLYTLVGPCACGLLFICPQNQCDFIFCSLCSRFTHFASLRGVAELLASPGHTGIRRVVLGHILNTQTPVKADEKKKQILSKFTILGCAAGYGLDTPASFISHN